MPLATPAREPTSSRTRFTTPCCRRCRSFSVRGVATDMMANPRTLLVAADSGMQAAVLRRGLEDAGYQVIEAHDGEEALALAASKHPHAVLSDIHMPRMNGYDLCRAIRRDKSLSTTPVILLSELSDPLDLVKGLDSCADAFVTKPYDFPTLVGRIEALTGAPVPPAPTGKRGRAKVSISGEMHSVPAQNPRILNLLASLYENAELQYRPLAST